MPRQRLLERSGRGAQRNSPSPTASSQAYGAFELQVLEELLRRPDERETAAGAARRVRQHLPQDRLDASRCRARDVIAFLRDFYTAQRAYLEREQLYGRPRADKYTQPAASA